MGSGAREETLSLSKQGVPWDELVAWSVSAGLCGLEALSGIRLVGAAPMQNIGAYGQEVADVVRRFGWSVTARRHPARRRSRFPHRRAHSRGAGVMVGITAVRFGCGAAPTRPVTGS